MFRNRALQVKMVKPEELPPTDQPPAIDHYAALATVSADRVAKSVTQLVAVYMASDTLRKIALHIVKTKVK